VQILQEVNILASPMTLPMCLNIV